jgi:hypothetical protein
MELIIIPNLIVYNIWIQHDGELMIGTNYQYYFKMNQCSYHVSFQYCNGSWIWINNVNLTASSIPKQYQFTEKTAVGIAVAIMHQSNKEYRRHLFQRAKDYTITKLMLLREIATKYLEYDLLIPMFNVTE